MAASVADTHGADMWVEPVPTPEPVEPVQLPVGVALIDLFARSPYKLTPEGVALLVAHYRHCRAAGMFRDTAHRAVADGKPPPKPRRSTAATADPAPDAPAPKTRKPRSPRPHQLPRLPGL